MARQLPTIDDILAAIPREQREQFSPTRYPYTYAADLVRQHPAVVPAWIHDLVFGHPNSAHLSRADASQLLSTWARSAHFPTDDEHPPHSLLAQRIADAYLQLHRVEGRP